MIRGQKPVRVKRFIWIDHVGEGTGWVVPKCNEKFKGIPWNWVAPGSPPFIEKYVDDKLVATINALDLSEIEFDNQE